jgi:hypothetical protein
MNTRKEALAKNLEESKRFLAALPELLKSELRDRWVLFMDGQVVGDFDSDDEARRAGEERFGYYGGFVVDKVRPHEPIVLFSGLRCF